ncbi:AsmA family protein [Notoacmeibacter marinus]|uniref:AsmA family protein n=1 Tax=Notoacmeibacter marinus TaxID=1876515 RepID=UPI000DF279B7|nr:AsmA-like C-terminal region-containing protein [Notoacmeibacter marinus]
MKRRLRTAGIVAASIAFAAAILLPALSYVGSQLVLRERIVSSLSRWTGQPVRIGRDLSIAYFPRLSAEVSDLRIGRAMADGQAPLRVRQASLQLSLIDALFGEANLSSVVLIGPELRIPSADTADQGPAILDNIVRRWIGTKAAPAPRGPGYLELRDGRVVSASGDSPPIAINIEGRLAGLDADRSLRFEGGANWRSLPISGSLQIERLRDLAKIQPTAVTASVRSPLGSFAFEGMFDPRHRNWMRALAGDFSFSSNRLAQFGRAVGLRLPVSLPRSLSMAGIIEQEDSRANLTLQTITLGDHSGTGTVGFTPRRRNSPAALSATLGFQTLDLMSVINRVDAPIIERRGRPRAGDTGRTAGRVDNLVSIDLRLSASEANYGAVQLANLAVSGRFGEGRSALDINNAQLLDGRLQGNWRREREPNGTKSRLELHFAGVSGSRLSKHLGLPGALPTGIAHIDLDLAGPSSLNRLLLRGEGTFKARFETGEIQGLDLAPLIEEELGGGFFSLSRLAGSDLDYDEARFEGSVRSGIAQLDDGLIRTGRYRIELKGRVPYSNGSLALSGRLLATPAPGLTGALPDDAVPSVLTRFFVGGSFTNPFINATPNR